MNQPVATHLMFEGNAAAALDLYAATFPAFKVTRIQHYAAGEQGAGLVKMADVDFAGHRLIVIDSRLEHAFTLTPAVTQFVDFGTVEELEATFTTLSAGGNVYMPLDNYGFSRRFGWVNDRFGVSWQLNFA